MATFSRIAPELPVRHLHRAIEYYERKLGFRVTAEMPESDYAIVERDDIAIHLFLQREPHQSRVGLHIFTNELEELCQELRHRGAFIVQEIVRKPWGNRDFRVQDDSGNDLKFTEPLQDRA